jgi:Anti-sigma factor NepR
MVTTNRRNRAVPAALTFSQRQSIQVLGLALRKLYKSYLKEPPPERFLPLIAKLDEGDRRSLSANDP